MLGSNPFFNLKCGQNIVLIIGRLEGKSQSSDYYWVCGRIISISGLDWIACNWIRWEWWFLNTHLKIWGVYCRWLDNCCKRWDWEQGESLEGEFSTSTLVLSAADECPLELLPLHHQCYQEEARHGGMRVDFKVSISFDKSFSRCGLSPSYLYPKLLCFTRRPY